MQIFIPEERTSSNKFRRESKQHSASTVPKAKEANSERDSHEEEDEDDEDDPEEEEEAPEDANSSSLSFTFSLPPNRPRQRTE